MNKDTLEVIELLKRLKTAPSDELLAILADYLHYEIAFNPINPSSEWKMLVHNDFDPGEQAVMAVLVDTDLNETTPVHEIRKRHDQVVKLSHELGSAYNVPLAAFLGHGRIVLYRIGVGNRDERLDLTEESVTKVSLYATQFNERLKKENIRLKEDEFGFGYDIVGLEELFKRTLSKRFEYMIELYRKKITESIVGSDIRLELEPLLESEAKKYLYNGDLSKLIASASFKTVVGSVVDTIILRHLLRRFLEGYHGIEVFESSGIALGVGAGTLEDALNEMVKVYHADVEDNQLKKALNVETFVDKQLSFDDLFVEEEAKVTAKVEFKENGKERLSEIHERMRKQFEIAYGGDLFAGSVAKVTNAVEKRLSETFPELIAKLWADTSTDQYSFRYEDLPPELLQHQYETSMSRAIQIQLLDGKPAVFYGDDKQEQKNKGAYYTDNRLVEYMVKQALEPTFEEAIQKIKEALEKDDRHAVRSLINDLINLKIVDITCGGGSFLRGAFYWLTEKHPSIVRLLQRYEWTSSLQEEYPFLAEGDAGRHAWEKHILTNMLYGIDIDYKALIICSQTLMLSALRHWERGKEFPELIGLTLIHQNALITPVPIKERQRIYASYSEEIAQLIQLRKQARLGDKAAREEAEELRQRLQLDFKVMARRLLGDVAEQLRVESLEINMPEVFFHEDGTWNENGGFDVALGNPPWEIWKPNAEEFFERYEPAYRRANKQEKIKIEKRLFNVFPELQKHWEAKKLLYRKGSAYFLNNQFYTFQRWKVDGKYTGSDINLYKVSLERFYQVLKENGRLSVLVPGTVTTDRGATGLRHLLLKEVSLQELLSFENRKKIFGAVHSSFKIGLITLKKQKPSKKHSFNVFFYRTDLEDAWDESKKMVYTAEFVKNAAPDTLSFLELRSDNEKDILEKMYRFPLLGSENTIQFTNELHMTNDSDVFREYHSELLPLYEGKTIEQYRADGPIRYGVAEKDLIKKVGKQDYKKYRMAYRAVASSTNKRTLIATILPRHVATGNSLFVQRVDGEEDYSKILVLTGLFNSFAVDFLLRRKVASNINLFYIYQLPIPLLDKEHCYYEEIVKRVAKLICTSEEYNELALAAGLSGWQEGVTDPVLRQQIQNQIDAYIADIYHLTREELIYILSTFESPKHKGEMRRIGQGVVEEFDTLKKKGELVCPK